MTNNFERLSKRNGNLLCESDFESLSSVIKYSVNERTKSLKVEYVYDTMKAGNIFT